MKKLMCAAFASLFTSFVNAESSNVYVFGAFGQGKIDMGITPVTATYDETATTASFGGGYRVTDDFSFEVAYIQSDDASISGTAGQTFRYQGTLYQFNSTGSFGFSYDAITVSGLLDLVSFGEFDSAIYARLDAYNYEAKTTVTTSSGSLTVADEGTDYGAGLGVRYAFNDSVSVGLEYRTVDTVDMVLGRLQVNIQ